MLLLLAFKQYLIFGIVIFSLIFGKWLWGNSPQYPVDLIGVMKREEDDDGNKYFKFHSEESNWDVIGDLWKRSQKNIFVTGQAGLSGKSTLLEAIENEVTDLEECKKYGIEPQNLVIFSPKHYDPDELMDFDLGRAQVVNCRYEMINPFEDAKAFKNSVAVMVSNDVNNRGIMASTAGDMAKRIIEYAPCLTWDDFFKNSDKVKDELKGDNVSIGVVNYLQTKLSDIRIDANVSDIPVEDVIFYLGDLEGRIARAFYYELYLQKYARELNSKKISRKPVLVLDEIHLIAKNEVSIISDFLRELRTRVTAIFVASQNWNDVDESLLQFAFCPAGRTLNLDPFATKPALRDCIALLEDTWFVDFAFTGTDVVPVYQVRKEYVDKLKAIKETALRRRIAERECQAQEDIKKRTSEPLAQESKKGLRDYEKSIIEILEKGEFCMTAHAITNALGYTEKVGTRSNIHTRTLPKMIDEDKIRKIDYITSTLKPEQKSRQYYYSVPNGESQVHRNIIKDTKKVLDKFKIKYTESQVNLGWDIYCQDFCIDAKSGLQHDVFDDLRKLKKSTQKVIFVCANYQVKQKYEDGFSSVEDTEGKFLVCCLNELEEILKEWAK